MTLQSYDPKKQESPKRNGLQLDIKHATIVVAVAVVIMVSIAIAFNRKVEIGPQGLTISAATKSDQF